MRCCHVCMGRIIICPILIAHTLRNGHLELDIWWCPLQNIILPSSFLRPTFSMDPSIGDRVGPAHVWAAPTQEDNYKCCG